MTTLNACELCRRADRLAGRRGKGQVQSVFETAINLQVGRRLLCLLGEGRALHPYGIVLKDVKKPGELGLRPGELVELGGGNVVFGDVCVCLDKAQSRDLSVGRLSELQQPKNAATRLEVLARAVAQSPGAAEGLAPLIGQMFVGSFPPLDGNRYSEFLLPRMRELPDILQGGDVLAISAAGRALAGCGPGLTPSSDDVLVGLSAAIWGADAAGAWPGGRRAARALAKGAAEGAGCISASYLKSAAQGLFSAGILDVLSAYFRQSEQRDKIELPQVDALQDLGEKAARVAEFGASSGADILSGMWMGLALAEGLGF